MITRIVIPQAFENMEEATIGAWLKAEGDTVQAGDALCELITEKTTFPLEAEAEGVLLRVAAAEKSIVPVGAVIGVIGVIGQSDGGGEPLPDIEAENAALRARVKDQETRRKGDGETGFALSVPSLSVPSLSVSALSIPAANTAASPAPGAGGTRVRATPAARRAARDKGVSIEDVAAAFPGKVLSEDDVAKFQR